MQSVHPGQRKSPDARSRPAPMSCWSASSPAALMLVLKGCVEERWAGERAHRTESSWNWFMTHPLWIIMVMNTLFFVFFVALAVRIKHSFGGQASTRVWSACWLSACGNNIILSGINVETLEQSPSADVRPGMSGLLAPVHLIRTSSASSHSGSSHSFTSLPFNFSALRLLTLKSFCTMRTEGDESDTKPFRPVSRHMMSASGWSEQIPNLLHCFFVHITVSEKTPTLPAAVSPNGMTRAHGVRYSPAARSAGS